MLVRGKTKTAGAILRAMFAIVALRSERMIGRVAEFQSENNQKLNDKDGAAVRYQSSKRR